MTDGFGGALAESAVPRGPRKPKRYWIAVTALAGALGAMGAVAGAGKASYDVTPFTIELRARPSLAGQTELAIRPASLNPGSVVAGTHAGPIAFGVAITGVSGDVVPSDLRALLTPRSSARFIGEEGKTAIRSFALLCAMLALAGGAAGGVAVSFGRWQRVLGGAVAGLLTFAIIGLIAQRTYQADEFLKSGRFARGGIPVLQPTTDTTNPPVEIPTTPVDLPTP